jgi:hypothetical protein
MHSVRQANWKAIGIRKSHKLSRSTIELIELREAKKETQQSARQAAEFAELNKRIKFEIRKDLREFNLTRTKSVLENSKSIKKTK